MNLKSVNKLETNKYELEIVVGAEEFENGLQQAFKKNAKQIQVPGFRKGKAPRKFIEKVYGEGVFYEDAVNALYPQAYSEAIVESGLTPVDRADIEVTEVGKDGFTFKAVVTTKPEVAVSGYKGIEVKKLDRKVADEDIDADIQRMRERNARIITVEDRAAENGDITKIDFEGFVDGVAFEGGKGENYSLTLGSNQFIPGFEDQIVGHNTGDEFDVNVTFPEEYQAEELAGKASVFKVKLHKIEKRELPELDDEFAKDVSEFETLAELREDVAKKIQDRLNTESENEVEAKLIDAVIAGLEAEIPEVMFTNRVDEMVRDFEYRMSSQGINLDLYLQYTGMDMDSLRANFREQADRQVKTRLALEGIVKAENIELTDEELEEEYKKAAESYNLTAEDLKKYVPAEDMKADATVSKAVQFVRDNAVITVVDSLEETKAEEPASEE
ncbi:MAG: trigger factor [Oscillospiraceae bacterium]|nr:trigger factor [Oscillospiraceae bacterium]MBQ3049752.1 trigger factor [Oscillospiraceae bacterium]MBQ9938332.1 trigger factor [Oscillospiraceae bacterium]